MNCWTRNILFALAALLAAILACTINVGGPSYPTPAIPVSTEAVAQLQQGIQTAVAAVEASGQVTLVFTEPGLTSYLYYYLEGQSNPLITNPQVYLQEDQIRIERLDAEAQVVDLQPLARPDTAHALVDVVGGHAQPVVQPAVRWPLARAHGIHD